VRQLFLKGGQRTTDFSWDLSVGHADNQLIGNGGLPESMLAQRREQIYTRPDLTDNESTLLTLNTTARLAPHGRWPPPPTPAATARPRSTAT
jgi:iron complex outermembrane receptor protein